MRPEVVFFVAFSLLGTRNRFIFGKKFKFEILFLSEISYFEEKSH